MRKPRNPSQTRTKAQRKGESDHARYSPPGSAWEVRNPALAEPCGACGKVAPERWQLRPDLAWLCRDCLAATPRGKRWLSSIKRSADDDPDV